MDVGGAVNCDRGRRHTRYADPTLRCSGALLVADGGTLWAGIDSTPRASELVSAGGGRVVVDATLSARRAGFDLLDSGGVLVSDFPTHIGAREVRRALPELNWPTDTEVVEQVASSGPGNVLLVELSCGHITTVCCGFERFRVRAEQVADGVVRSVRSWIYHQAPVGPFLADQRMLVSRSVSAFNDAEIFTQDRSLKSPARI